MSSEVNGFLAHYGVKGMKWGVRKDRKGGSSRRSKSSSESSESSTRSPGRVRRGAQKLKSKWDNLDPDIKDAAVAWTSLAVASVGGMAYRSMSSGHMAEIKRAQSFTEYFMSGGDGSRPEPTAAKRRRGAYVTTTMRG